MEKYDYISELAENTAFEIVQNQEEWKKYLTTAARLYKYPFREQAFNLCSAARRNRMCLN